MSELSIEKFEQINNYWAQLGPREMKAARDIVHLLQVGSVLSDTFLEHGEVPLYSLTLGRSVEASGTAQMLEYGVARFEGKKFIAGNHGPFMAADIGNRLLLPTWHTIGYEHDRLRVDQVSGYVDFDADVDVNGDVYGDTSILRVTSTPTRMKMLIEDKK